MKKTNKSTTLFNYYYSYEYEIILYENEIFFKKKWTALFALRTLFSGRGKAALKVLIKN